MAVFYDMMENMMWPMMENDAYLRFIPQPRILQKTLRLLPADFGGTGHKFSQQLPATYSARASDPSIRIVQG